MEEKNELLKTFQALDLNGDGELSKDELIQGYQKIMEKDKAIKEAEKILK
jgi:calcium-dependent protein kinase